MSNKKTDVKQEKKSTGMTVLIITAIIVIIIALFYPSSDNLENEPIVLTKLNCEKESDETFEESKLNKVSCNGYQSLVEESEDNLILIARPSCGFCVKFIPILEEIVDEYGIEINYFDTDTLSQNENTQFYKSSSLYSSNKFGTPTLVVTNNNEITKYSIGYKEKDAAVNWLKENGIITE